MRATVFIQPMKPWRRLRSGAAILAGRLTSRLLRLVGRAATALPGKLALTLAPGLLADLTAGRQVFLVTGTNGKTTTVRMLCRILEDQGRAVITNPSGANLDSGLTTTLLAHVPLLRQKAGRQAALVFEIDEAFFGKLAATIKPAFCLVTNFFRDQLDRFGELKHTRDLIAKGLRESQAQAILCADDSLCASLGRESRQAVYFGLAEGQLRQTPDQGGGESPFCVFCGSRYQYSGVAYGHLGLFRCPGCGFERSEPDLSFQSLALTERSVEVRFAFGGQAAETTIPVPGLHNAYNAAGALLAAVRAGIPLADAAASLSKTQAAFGRMERFAADGKEVCLILVKNPVGMERALDFVARANDVGSVMMLLNANDPDGRDVSWIWDVRFEEAMPAGPIGVSGVRCADLALRLRYAGKPSDELWVSPEHLALFDRCLALCPQGRCLYILPNYTPLLALRADLAPRYQLPEIWR